MEPDNRERSILDASPVEVVVTFGEIHARYTPAHGYGAWWLVLIPRQPPFFDWITPGADK